MILEGDAVDGNLSAVSAVTEVENELGCSGIDTRKVLYIEDIVALNEILLLNKEEVVVAGGVCELESNSTHCLVGSYEHGHVVVACCGEGHGTCRNEVNLSLPLLVATLLKSNIVGTCSEVDWERSLRTPVRIRVVVGITV